MNINYKPKRMPNVHRRSEKRWVFLFDPGIGRLLRMNEVGDDIWCACDGTHSVDEIIEMICSNYDVQREVAERDILNVLDTVSSLDLIL